jgi:hypothetical protein
MSEQDFQQLVNEYGEELARQAKEWYENNHTVGFMACVSDSVQYCIKNELLWNTGHGVPV